MSLLPVFVPRFNELMKIPIQENTIAADVKSALWERLKIDLNKENIGYRQLSLLSLPGPIDIEPEETLTERVQSCANDLRRIGHAEKVSMHSSWLTPDAVQLILHIETAFTPEIPQEPPQKRRKIKQADFLSGPFVTNPPSSLGNIHIMHQVQKNPDERIANDRPNVDADLPPISLMYHGFGQFLDCIHTDSTNLECVANKPNFELAIDKFICEMSMFYESESARQSKTVDCLNEIFESYLGKQPYSLIIPSFITGKRSTDGHAIGPIGTIEVGVEIKNEFGTSSCDPSVEFAAYYSQSLHAKALQYLENNFLFPALGIVVVGAHIGFYALTFTTTTRLVALTPLLPMAIETGNRNARQDLLKAFEAACILRLHINEDTQNFKDNPQECSLPD
ncbi:hypothetical protein B0F90DRAFT_726280 [Multifurca ochricompacta]|uniref:Uncharacterized protein n=1 Tax=Multifurca ochricompacta TaxID=376703 RepID=A0AAD4QRN7_9AGAM|nr:hypothetical protein B0F90DRAFT_726280 [Multifurca ochricompacta]